MRSGVVGVVLTATLAFGASPAIAAGTGTGTACSTNCTIYALDGSGQAALVGTAFAAGLAVEVVGAAPSSSVSVTFLAPASGPSGTFAGAGTSATATGTTSSAGTASVTAPPFVANTIAGSYSVYASISTVATPAVFSLTNIGPGAIAAVAGTPASSLIGTTFSTELAVEVTDSSGTAVPGVQVSFAAPSSGPSGEFAGGGANATATTNASGVATAPPFVANTIAGAYRVYASISAVATPAVFHLTNHASSPATVTVVAGTSTQSAGAGSTFATPFAVVVTDAYHNDVAGARVTFAAPSSGPSGEFVGGGAQVTAVTNASGVATAPPFVANGATGGPYTVTASVVGVPTSAQFSLTNTNALSYWLVSSHGAVYDFGDARFYGSFAYHRPAPPIVGIASTPDGKGYWLVSSHGAVYGFGDAHFYGSLTHRPAPLIVGIASTPDGKGYWLVSSHGAVYDFGDARFYGSFAYHRPAPPIVGIASTPDGKGYWLVSSHGAVYGFGDARFYGSTASRRLGAKVVGIARTPDGKGYWLLGQNGAVYSFGNAGFYGSLAGLLARSRPVTAMIATPGGQGYWLVGANGAVYSFGDAGYSGDAAGFPPGGAVVGVATTAAS